MAASPSSPELALIEEFKKGYVHIIERMASLAKAAQQILTSSAIAPVERQKLAPSMAELDKSLGTVQNEARALIARLSTDTIKKDAARDFHSVFTGDMSDHRLQFLVFLKSMIYLKRFALETSDIWSRARSVVLAAELDPMSEFRSQFLEYRVQPALHLCEAITIFTNRMGRILKLKRDPLTTKDLGALADYATDGNYQLSAVFQEELTFEDPVVVMPEEAGHYFAAPGSAAADLAAAIPKPAVPGAAYFLDTTGKSGFNSGPSYVFSYDPAALDEERKVLPEVIYVDTHMGADQNFIRSEFVLQTVRKATPAGKQNPEEQYERFLHGFFELVMDISLLNLGVPANLKKIFFYHLGPQYFYHLTRRFLLESKTGTMHRRVGGGRMIQKFVPAELTRKVILEWWRDNILPAVEGEKDDVSLYKKVVNLVKSSYDSFGRKAMDEYDSLPEAQQAKMNRNQVIREHLDKWLGTTNIIIFRRFLRKQ